MPDHIVEDPSAISRRPHVITALAVAAIPVFTFVGGFSLTGWAVAGPTHVAAPQVIVAER